MGGVNRSAALVYLLRHPPNGGHDAVAIGYTNVGTELRDFLFRWADRIVVMEQYMCAFVPAEWRYKSMICEVGPDRFGNPRHAELLALCQKFIDENFR